MLSPDGFEGTGRGTEFLTRIVSSKQQVENLRLAMFGFEGKVLFNNGQSKCNWTPSTKYVLWKFLTIQQYYLKPDNKSRFILYVSHSDR